MSLIFVHATLINLYIFKYREATGATFIHAKSVKSVKTACVCIVIFHYFKYGNRCFPVDFTKFLRTPSFIESLWWLLLIIPFSSQN